MDDREKQKNVFEIVCPCCSALLWVDEVSHEVIQSEKPPKKKGSLDDLLLKEKQRTEDFGRKFDATVELQKQKLERAKEKFAKALTDLDDQE
ncbi:MAG TPA: hypothetical protein PLX50_05315 [Candidatus Aminicenantes bacterium]|nr:hypothetical protein [Candidatus Aminicenantes bacterium]